MSISNFPNGASSFGVPVIGSGTIPTAYSLTYLFVNGTTGSDYNAGTDPSYAFKTIKAAVAGATAGTCILVMPGTYTEAAITITTAGLRIIGLGTAAKQVTATSATDVTTITINANGVEIANIYFKPPVYTADVTVASIKLGTSGSYAYIHDCRFQGQTGSYNAIYSATPGSDNVTIANNQFIYMNTTTYGAGVYGIDVAGSTYSAWRVIGNTFESCVVGFNVPMRVGEVYGNTFGINGVTSAGVIGAPTTTALSLAGVANTGDVGANKVHGNYFDGSYAKSYYVPAGATDDWGGNFNMGVTYGITKAVPA
jgi:hypothetical protein